MEDKLQRTCVGCNKKKNKYDYKLVNYYEVDKTGVVQIIKNNDVNCLTLITCKKNTNKQLVFIFELEKVI